jgi:hypothetical protein
LGETLASEWFGAGDHFAVVGARGTRNFAFPARPLAWQAGEPWDERVDPAHFVRLPRCYDLDQIRRTRLAIVGLGHVGSAVLHQIAALPWAGLLLLDRDHFEPHNAPAHAFAPPAAGSPAAGVETSAVEYSR